MKWEDGNEYPVIRSDISSDSHPFYTGRQKFAAADGRGTIQQKVWSQIKQQLIVNINCLRNLSIKRCRQFCIFTYLSTIL